MKQRFPFVFDISMRLSIPFLKDLLWDATHIYASNINDWKTLLATENVNGLKRWTESYLLSINLSVLISYPRHIHYAHVLIEASLMRRDS